MDSENVALIVAGVVWIVALVANIEALRMVEQPGGALRAAAITCGSIGIVLVVVLPFLIPVAFYSEATAILFGLALLVAVLGTLGSIATIVLADVVDLAGRRRGRQP